ncbi:MAG: hypothetical protein LBJ20_03235 [Candidatus Methanoplasma sp.]|jgi:hypothetical protein|nr:hypothetical protein [Candidatus Methanoplasma sp.]
MKFEDMSKAERTAYKKTVIGDFIEHGMDEKEALVNYVFCINPQPFDWLEHRYGIRKDEAVSLRDNGMSKYRETGGTYGFNGPQPSPVRKRTYCKCVKPIVPQ